MRTLLKTTCLAIALLSCSMAFAVEGTRGGGDEAALEFQRTALLVSQEIKSSANLGLPASSLSDFEKAISRMEVLVTNDPLPVEKDGFLQLSAAINDSTTYEVLLNRARWTEITDENVKKALVLHEILSLIGLEKTASYPLSKKYLAHLSQQDSRSSDMAPPRPLPRDGEVRHVDLKRTWEKAGKFDESSLVGEWRLVTSAHSAPCAFLGKGVYDPNGIRHGDGSLFLLQFQYESVGRSGFGAPNPAREQVLTVRKPSRKHGASQGPFEVSATEPQFSLWAHYESASRPSTDFYWEYSCRATQGSSNELICAVSFRLTEEGRKYASDSSKACAAETHGTIVGFYRN